MVVAGPIEPILLVRRLAAMLDHALVHGHQPRLRPHRVVQLLRLPWLAQLGVPGRVAGAVEGRPGDVVHLQVVGMQVATLIVAIGDDDLRASRGG
jgi:hypothetical protein